MPTCNTTCSYIASSPAQHFLRTYRNGKMEVRKIHPFVSYVTLSEKKDLETRLAVTLPLLHVTFVYPSNYYTDNERCIPVTGLNYDLCVK